MNTFKTPDAPDIQAMINSEKRKDTFIRRVSVTAWSVTMVIILIYGVIVGLEFARVASLASIGAVQSTAVIDVLIPFIAVLGVVSLLIATLGTVGIFLRLRTASLSEIQMRLAALESILTTERSSA